MNMQAEKLQLVRMLIETDDKGILKQIKAIFEGRSLEMVWDDEVRNDVDEAIRQADSGELIPHDKAVTMLKKWA